MFTEAVTTTVRKRNFEMRGYFVYIWRPTLPGSSLHRV